MPARPTSLPIRKLRALGCKVSTVEGHDPLRGEWRYGVTLPSPHTAQTFLSRPRIVALHEKYPRINVAATHWNPSAIIVWANNRRRPASEWVRDADIADVLSAVALALEESNPFNNNN